jgi:hypothetical protein
MFEHVHRRKTESRPRPAKGAISKASSMLMTAAVLAAMIAPLPVSAQLLNGGFENQPQSNPFATVNAGSFIDPAVGLRTWKVTLGSVDVGTGPAGTTCHYLHCVDLNGNAPGRIEQTMVTVAGSSCTVRFFMSRHTGLTTATLTTFINGAPTSPATFTHNIAGVTPADGKWQAQSFTFTASGSDVIAFGTAMPANAGPQVDDVSMVCTPHPPAPPTVNPCCPPWNTAALRDNMFYQGVGGIGGQYTLKFTPSTLLNSQLTAYMAYVHVMVPTATSISVDFKMYDAGIGGSPVLGLAVSGSSTETWLTSGPPTPSAPTWFVTPPLTSTHMQIGRWYTIQTVIHLNPGGAVFFSDSCSRVDMSVRLQVLGRAPNAPGGEGVLQFRMPDGKIVERSVKQP